MLPLKRWFGAKERVITSVSVIDDTDLDDGPPPLTAALVRIDFADGGSDVYNLLLIAATGAELQDPFEKDSDRLKALGRHMAHLSLIHISEPTRRTPISYAVFC